MRFTALFVAAFASLAIAQSPNAFNIPPSGLSFTAGQPTTITWTPSTQGTVTLVLRNGASNDLNAGTPIATSIPNSGSFTWTPDPSTVRGTDYTIQIIDDSNPQNVNYSPYFVIESTNTVASQSAPLLSSTFTSGAPTASLTLSTASPTASVSFSTTGSASAASTTGTSSGSASGTMTTSTRASSASSGTASAASASVVPSGAASVARAAGAGVVGLAGVVAWLL